MNLSSISRTSSSRRRVGQDAVGGRPQEALERGALRRVREDLLEPRIVGDAAPPAGAWRARRTPAGPSSAASVWSLAVICSRRRPVRSAMSTYGTGGGASSALTSWSGVMFLRRTNVPAGARRSGRGRSAMKTNARRSASKPSSSSRVGDRLRACRRPRRGTRPGPGRSRPEWSGPSPRFSATMSATNGSWRAAGLSSARRHDRAADDGPQDRQGDRQHDRRQDQREDEELEEADQPVPATTAVRRRRGRAGPARSTRGSSRSRRRRDRTAGPSRSGDRAGVRRSGSSSVGLLGVVGSWHGRTTPARVSSSSWRMIAAASRSTRAR